MTDRMTKKVHVGMVSVLVDASQKGGKKHPACRKTQPESWSPNFPGDLVEVSLLPLTNGDWRVCVWGADDTGMEFDSQSRAEVLWRYEAIGDGVTREALSSAGFIPA